MARWMIAALYTALVLGAINASGPALADVAVARTLAQADTAGGMRKLVFHDAPQPLPQVGLTGMDDGARSLAEWRGRWVVVNFWATWCAPCRKEMPALDRLAAGGVAVVTVASGRNPVPAIERFWAETGIVNLPALRDPNAELSRKLAILGLPVTLIVNPEGAEVARLIGDAAWDAPEARAVLDALMAP